MDNTKSIFCNCNFLPKNIEQAIVFKCFLSRIGLFWFARYGYGTPHTSSLIKDNWPVPLTMEYGSFIAGSTIVNGRQIRLDI